MKHLFTSLFLLAFLSGFSQTENKIVETPTVKTESTTINEDYFAERLLATFKDPSLADSFLITHSYIISNVSNQNRKELEGMSELFNRWHAETMVIIETYSKYSKIEVEQLELVEQNNDGVLFAYAGELTLLCDNVEHTLKVGAFQLKGKQFLGMLREIE